MARRPLAAALVLAAGALVLTGCIPEPPAIPQSPVQPADPQPADPAQPSESADAPDSGAPSGEANVGLGEMVTVDDEAGDSWSFAVTGIEENPPLESGDSAPGTRFVAVLLDGERVEGGVGFIQLFDIWVVGSDGGEYYWADTVEATAEEDVYFVGDSFAGARALIQLPEGVDPELVVARSAYGHPQVEDVVVDVR